MDYNDYNEGKIFWETSGFDPESITTEQLKEVIVNTKCRYIPPWFRSMEFYTKNLDKYKKSITERKQFYPDPLDNEYLRTYILPKLPLAPLNIDIFGNLYLYISEISINWTNYEWWFNNIRAIILLIESLYIKKSVRESLEQSQGLPKGPYHSWLSRIIQFINTYRSECFIAENLKLNNLPICKKLEDSHFIIHAGLPTEVDQLPDLELLDGRRAEVKVCSKWSFAKYQAKLRDNFEKTMFEDFHEKDGITCDGALFVIKGENGEPLKLYSIDLSSYEAAQHYTDKSQDLDLSKLKLILDDDNGKLARSDWPALPPALLFGLKASWLK